MTLSCLLSEHEYFKSVENLEFVQLSFNYACIFIKVWDLFYEADKVRAMLARKIQEETLRTYLFTYSKVYDSISVVSCL